MTTLGPYEVHPFADRFALVEGQEFDELVESVRKHGNRQPITLTHDKRVLVDGRNRYRACVKAGREPAVRTLPATITEVEILDFIVAANIERRHLDAGQRAFLALEYDAAYTAATKNGRPIGNSATTDGNKTRADRRTRSDERAAKVTGASGRSVQRAKALQRDTPHLADQVRNGQLALDAADRQRRQVVRNQPRPEPPPKPAPVMLTLRTHKGAEIPYPKPTAKAAFNETKGEGISWAAWSWNPVTGCLHGCDYCYAREIATSERFRPGFPVGFTPLFHNERLDAPANTVIPAAHRSDPAYKRVFVCSMADLYGRWVPDEWISQVHESMFASPQWEYLLLTKFPARYVGLNLPPAAWVGTSVDEQKRVRIAENAFQQIGGVKVKWLSLEPLREPLEFTDLSIFDWVVIGAQTETRQPDGIVPAFSPPAEWVVRITAQALDAGCRVHWKPNLRTAPGMRWLNQYPPAREDGPP